MYSCTAIVCVRILHVSVLYCTPFWGLYSTDTIAQVHCTLGNCPGDATASCIAPDCTYWVVRSVYLTNLAGPLLGPERLLSNRPSRLSVLHTVFSPIGNSIIHFGRYKVSTFWCCRCLWQLLPEGGLYHYHIHVVCRMGLCMLVSNTCSLFLRGAGQGHFLCISDQCILHFQLCCFYQCSIVCFAW